MLAEKKDISINRGDTIKYKIKLVNQDDETIVLSENDTMYFTIKENYEIQDFVIQKKLNDGITYSENDNCYHVIIEAYETENLNYKNYVYDIQVSRNVEREGSAQMIEKTTVIRGNFAIGEVVTFTVNE